RAGAEAIYQAALVVPPWLGHADFLRDPQRRYPGNVGLNCCASLRASGRCQNQHQKANGMERNPQLRHELLADVAAVAPTLAEHAADSEGLARLNAASIEALRQTRLL